MSNKPHMRVTYKNRDGERFQIGTLWPARKGDGFTLQPCTEHKETKYSKEMPFSEACELAYGQKSGFIDFWPITERRNDGHKPQRTVRDEFTRRENDGGDDFGSDGEIPF
jgi:hypothetical protein